MTKLYDRGMMGDRIKLVDAMLILERESINLEQDFHAFFPELQQQSFQTVDRLLSVEYPPGFFDNVSIDL